MRWQLAMIVAALAACGSEERRSCVPTEYQLTFQPADTRPDEYLDDDRTVEAPVSVAVGGTERFTVVAVDDCGSAGGPGPLVVSSGNPAVATVTATGATIDIQGVAVGAVSVGVTDTLDVSHTLYVGVGRIDSVQLVADEVGEPGAFFVGIPQVKVKLLDADGFWLVDRALAVTGDIPQGDAWNVLDTAGAGVGDHTVTVHVGALTVPVTATIVDHLDDVMAGSPTMMSAVPSGQRVCFYAHTGGAVVAGVPWTFDYDTSAGHVSRPNCVEVWPRDRSETSTTITAHALGLSTTATVKFPR